MKFIWSEDDFISDFFLLFLPRHVGWMAYGCGDEINVKDGKDYNKMEVENMVILLFGVSNVGKTVTGEKLVARQYTMSVKAQ